MITSALSMCFRDGLQFGKVRAFRLRFHETLGTAHTKCAEIPRQEKFCDCAVKLFRQHMGDMVSCAFVALTVNNDNIQVNSPYISVFLTVTGKTSSNIA